MSLRHGLQAIVRVVRRRVQQQAQQHVHSARQGPDGVPSNPGGRTQAFRVPDRADGVARWSRNAGVSHQNQHNLASRASRIWRLTSRTRIPQANGSRMPSPSQPILPLLLGFAGIGFVRRDSALDENGDNEMVTEGKHIDLETAIQLVRSVFRDHDTKPTQSVEIDYPIEIAGYAISENVLAKGTEGVVYAAKQREIVPSAEEDASLASTMDVECATSEVQGKGCETGEQRTKEMTICDEKECNFAIKMMFNYNIGSVPSDIVAEFHSEQLPLLLPRGQFGPHVNSQKRATNSLISSHPNIVQMHQAFVDRVRVPCLEAAISMFDMALPRRLNPVGAGADTTLYIIMKRYRMSLREYLGSFGPPPDRTAMLIVAQLLEAVGYLGNQGIIHRDLKSNNILVDYQEKGEVPHVVIADFGCAVSLRGQNLSGHVTDSDRNRQGNTALMAPELKRAYRQNNICYRDYLKADAWAVGAIAYEVCGQRNPFYTGLDSDTYSEHSLPQLQTQAVGLSVVVDLLLQRDPNDRPTPVVAADVLHLFLWQPSVGGLARLCRGQSSRDRELVSWLMKVSMAYLLRDHMLPGASTAGGHGLPQDLCEQSLVGTFLRRVSADSLTRAAHCAIAVFSQILVPDQTADCHRQGEETSWQIAAHPVSVACQV